MADQSTTTASNTTPARDPRAASLTERIQAAALETDDLVALLRDITQEHRAAVERAVADLAYEKALAILGGVEAVKHAANVNHILNTLESIRALAEAKARRRMQLAFRGAIGSVLKIGMAAL